MLSRSLLLTPVLAVTAACGAVAPAPLPAPHPAPSAVTTSSLDAGGAPALAASEPRFSWKTATLSPRPGGAFDPGDRELLAACAAGDDALAAAALLVGERRVRGLSELEMSEVSFALRAAGSPYVWPRVWSLEARTLDRAETARMMQRWLESFADGGERRCGVASLASSEKQLTVAVAVDVLADLSSLPTRVKSGQWVEVRARLLVPASEAKVVLLGPVGRPKTIVSSFNAGEVSARFVADRSGSFLVQVVANAGSGPRPVAEALVHADLEPPPSYRAMPAPGENALAAGDDPAAAIAGMVNGARASEGLPALRRDDRLDAIAERQALAMHAAQRVGHDLGFGDPAARVTAAGLEVSAAGENVSHAPDAARAHRSLWASPSHRGNLLHARYDSIGVAAVRDADGSLWVCEVFADFR
jgi:uncharacterized protein YkwD